MSAASKESDEECETAGTSSMMESTMMEGEEYYHPETTVAWTEKARGSDQLCRICANANEYLIPIFSGEGAEHQLGMKIDKHLPIQVVKQDKLPLHVCYQCASTLIAWHDLHMGCVEAEKKLRQMFPECEEEVEHDSDDDDKADDFYSEPMESEMTEDPLEPSTSAASKPNRPSRSPRKKTVTKAKPKLKLTLVKTPVAILPKGAPKLLQPKEEQTDPDPASERSPIAPRPTVFMTYLQTCFTRTEHYARRPVNQCHFCMATFSTRAELATHLTQSHSDVVFHCSTCDEFFKTKRLLAAHCRTHEPNGYYAGCSRLKHALTKPTLEPVTLFVCRKCGRDFKRNYHFVKHKCIGTPIVVLPPTSGTVDRRRIQDGVTVASESVKNEKGKTLFRCELCSKSFKLKESYKAHQRIHTGEKPFTCHICGKSFSHTGGLYYHLKHVHGGVKEHSCDICGRSFALKAAMEDHRRIHTGERPFVCHTCGKSFKTKASLYIHSKIHTDSFPHPCTYCERRFRWRQQLLSHLTTHTGDKPHVCLTCGKGFGVKNDLTRHNLIHSGNKPFSCTLCSLKFGQKRYLKNHYQSRHGLLP